MGGLDTLSMMAPFPRSVERILLTAAIVFVYWNGLFAGVARADQVAYLHQVTQYDSLRDILVTAPSWNRTHSPGDYVLFRPVLYWILGIEYYVFGYRAFFWQLLGLAAHTAVAQLLLSVLRRTVIGNTVLPRLRSQQFSGYALWSMKYGGPLAPLDRAELAAAVASHADTPDSEALQRCERFAGRLPPYLRIGPPSKFGEIGWHVDNVIVNHDTWAHWERLTLLYEAGLLDRESPKCLMPGARVLEIGAGYGGLAWYLQQVCPEVHYTVVDIPESLVYSAIYLSALCQPLSLRFLANYEFLELVYSGEQFDLIINTLSMSEMREGQVRVYCQGLRRLLADTGSFFEQNQDHRRAGWVHAQDLVAEYLPYRQPLGGPPELPHGFANVWRHSG
jgi:hypothetical protein